MLLLFSVNIFGCTVVNRTWFEESETLKDSLQCTVSAGKIHLLHMKAAFFFLFSLKKRRKGRAPASPMLFLIWASVKTKHQFSNFCALYLFGHFQETVGFGAFLMLSFNFCSKLTSSKGSVNFPRYSWYFHVWNTLTNVLLFAETTDAWRWNHEEEAERIIMLFRNRFLFLLALAALLAFLSLSLQFCKCIFLVFSE